MNRRSSILWGGVLILLGILLLVFGGVASVLGLRVGGFLLRFWPVVVVAAGLALVVPPLLNRSKRGLGALFIPGFPILMTGAILSLASIFDSWSTWAWLWPMEALALATGFLMAAIWMRVIWLIIPAMIIGFNGLVFQFCAITGLWEWWAILWVIEPLSVGLALLTTGFVKNKRGLTTAGLILCAIAGFFLVLMATILGSGLPFLLLGPGLLILGGFAILAWGLLRHRVLPKSALE
jgi:hypothetical protein